MEAVSGHHHPKETREGEVEAEIMAVSDSTVTHTDAREILSEEDARSHEAWKKVDGRVARRCHPTPAVAEVRNEVEGHLQSTTLTVEEVTGPVPSDRGYHKIAEGVDGRDLVLGRPQLVGQGVPGGLGEESGGRRTVV